jgi:hypothetical protein
MLVAERFEPNHYPEIPFVIGIGLVIVESAHVPVVGL